ncbi:MAG TPA: GNAT family N-acetyltransferase [Gammaproteobacteria bacterium]|nr:GNAT family N-acetyltransferase [Gammaproteobacteria bacterium]
MQDLPSSLRIAPLAPGQHVSEFDCDDPQVNAGLHQNQEDSPSSRVIVAIDDRDKVLGYYAVSAINIEFANRPETLPQSVTEYPIPAAFISHLAVDKNCARKGVGASLLIDALQRIEDASALTGTRLVMVQADSTSARTFYLHFGFIPVAGEPGRLYLPIKQLNELFRDRTAP